MNGPLVVRSDRTLLLDVDHPDAEACRRELAVFAELVSSPEHVHTYRVGELGLWNARAAGHDAEDLAAVLERWSTTPVPRRVLDWVMDQAARFGAVVVTDDARHGLVVRARDAELLDRLLGVAAVAEHLGPRIDATTAATSVDARGPLKQALVAAGWPPDDDAAVAEGAPLAVGLRPELELRPYQRAAVDGWAPSGSGVVVLPCGAGKTVVAIAAMAELGQRTLILTTGTLAVEQWRRELLRFTDLSEEQVAEYSGRRKRLAPVTVATYQVVATRRGGRFVHLPVLRDEPWGLVVYDEVHLLPAGVVRMTADVPTRRRLGLTATLVREDGREGDVFGLIGPKRFDAPWRDLELQGWIAPARCTEVRVPLTEGERRSYAEASPTARPVLAAGAVGKRAVVEQVLGLHPDEQVLVIGTYVEPLAELAAALGAPMVSGTTPAARRQELVDDLRAGCRRVLVVSRIGSTSIDLPETSVLVQVSGTFGSRQEEAQRLGRVLRPKADGGPASFYALVARDTVEQEHAPKRQRFLTEQGYAYRVVDADEVRSPSS